ncbi:MAG TPA: aldose epimerase family protein [Kineosporiaceae bacterium]|nr:aldose epimerase family protein [Kineosporiaceae bacterium]
MTAVPATVRSALFGELPDGRPVTRFELRTASAVAGVLDYGAVLHTLTVPDREGIPGNVILGMADPAGYAAQDAYFGAVVGRVANRITGGRFTLDGAEYQLACNQSTNNLHGGPDGFDRRLWAAAPVDGPWPHLRLDLTSPDGDQGFPARLDVVVDYLLEERMPGRPRLWIRYAARNGEPGGGRSTPVNLTHHAYFNLAGEGSGSVEGQLIQIPASRYTPVREDLIPTGQHADVAGTPFDLRAPAPLGPRMRTRHEQVLRAQGLDHNWVIDDDAPVAEIDWPATTAPDPADPAAPQAAAVPVLRLAMRALDPGSGRQLDVWSDRPGVQLYTSNFLHGTIAGTSGRLYRQGEGFTAETQDFPDAPNQPGFPSIALGPQRTYRSTTVFAFGTD